jgi:hypothetical protein
MSLLDEHGRDFVDRNPLTPLLLGMISLLRRLDRVLPEAPGVASDMTAPEVTAAEVAPAPPSPPEDRLLLMVLGLISVRRTLLGALAPLRAASDGASSPTAPSEREVPAPRDLLR